MRTPTFRLDDDGRHVWWHHHCLYVGINDDGTVSGLLPLDAERGWQVQSLDPLTVTPSILCQTCGTHGFITAGKWMPA